MLYIYNLVDKYDIYIGVVIKIIKVLCLLLKDKCFKKFYVVEVWCDFDWLNDDEKVVFSVGGRLNFINSLVEVFDL